MYQYLYTITCFVAFFFFSCTKGDDNSNNLISWSREYVMDDGEQMNGYYQNRLSFIKPYISVKFVKDTVLATTLFDVNSCGDTEGFVKISNDTIYLSVKSNDYAKCSSVQFYKYSYKVYNPQNIKFKIVW